MKNQSIWKKTLEAPEFPLARGDIKADVLIVGGGIAGILCAHRLKARGVSCILAEKDRILGGTTGNTTAKITLSHGLIYDRITSRYGEERARMYLLAQRAAMAEYERLCRDIDCDYEVCDNYVYSRSDEECIEKEVAALERLGEHTALTKETELPFKIAGAVKTEGQARFHPLKFLYALAKDLPIYEHTKILELTPHGALYHGGSIRAKHIIIATHFPILNKHGAYFLKLYQHRSYVLALENAKTLGGMYVDEAKDGFSFRAHGNLLLLGGGSHRTAERGGGYRALEELRARYYEKSREVARFATQDCMSLDGIPYIGRYSKSTEGLYVATGFNKWGMTNAMAAAMLLADQLTGKYNEYAPVFSVNRSILHPQTAVNLIKTLIGFFPPTAPRCPHLGCALKYNAEEHSWDCPCHGSRFAEDGSVLDNPATADKKAFKANEA